MGPVEDETKTVSVTHPQLYKETERRCGEMQQIVTSMAQEQNEVIMIILVENSTSLSYLN